MTRATAWFGTRRIRKLLTGDGLRAQLLRGGVGSLAVKASHAVIAFALAVVLARTLGPEGYGVYSFALAILMLTAIPAQVGVPQLIVRETAKAQANHDWGLMRGLWRWGNSAVAACSLFALAVVGSVLLFSGTRGDGVRVETLVAGLALIPLLALANVRGACLRGLRKVVQGLVPESIVRPLLLLILVGIWGRFVVRDGDFSAQQAMGLYVVAALTAFSFGAWLLWRSRPVELWSDPEPKYNSKFWRKAVLPLALIAGLQLINNYLDLLVLGIFRTDSEVGVYRAVSQTALLIIFGLQAMNQMLQPHFARLYERKEHVRLQRLVTTSARVILAFALPPVLILIVFGSELLGLVFGDPFRMGGLALGILACGHLVNAGMGSVGLLLNMTGHERDTVRGVGIAAVLNLILNFILIPPFGIEGAAAATGATLAVWNLVLRHYVRKRLKIEPSAIGRNCK